MHRRLVFVIKRFGVGNVGPVGEVGIGTDDSGLNLRHIHIAGHPVFPFIPPLLTLHTTQRGVVARIPHVDLGRFGIGGYEGGVAHHTHGARVVRVAVVPPQEAATILLVGGDDYRGVAKEETAARTTDHGELARVEEAVEDAAYALAVAAAVATEGGCIATAAMIDLDVYSVPLRAVEEELVVEVTGVPHTRVDGIDGLRKERVGTLPIGDIDGVGTRVDRVVHDGRELAVVAEVAATDGDGLRRLRGISCIGSVVKAQRVPHTVGLVVGGIRAVTRSIDIARIPRTAVVPMGEMVPAAGIRRKFVVAVKLHGRLCVAATARVVLLLDEVGGLRRAVRDAETLHGEAAAGNSNADTRIAGDVGGKADAAAGIAAAVDSSAVHKDGVRRRARSLPGERGSGGREGHQRAAQRVAASQTPRPVLLGNAEVLTERQPNGPLRIDVDDNLLVHRVVVVAVAAAASAAGTQRGAGKIAVVPSAPSPVEVQAVLSIVTVADEGMSARETLAAIQDGTTGRQLALDDGQPLAVAIASARERDNVARIAEMLIQSPLRT